jgi:hypothetical protein
MCSSNAARCQDERCRQHNDWACGAENVFGSGVAMVLFHHMYAHIPEPRCQCRSQHLAMCPRRYPRTPWKIESPITTRAVGRGFAAAPSTSAVNAKHDMICAVHSHRGIAWCTVSVMQRGRNFAKLCAVVLLMLRLTKCRSRLTECLLTCIQYSPIHCQFYCISGSRHNNDKADTTTTV